jgi:hypothetical protein
MKINTLKWLVAALLLAATVNLQAQLGAPSTVVQGGVGAWTNSIAANSTYTTNTLIDCTAKKDVAIQWAAELSGAGTTANTMVIQSSVDNSNWVTYVSLSMTPAGTTPVIVQTNLTVGAIPYLRVRSMANASANTGSITNYTVKVYNK